MTGLLLLCLWCTAQAQEQVDPVFVSAGFTGYTIAPLSSDVGRPNVAFRMELHRNITFMARAANHHTVGLAFDFVGIDVSKKWRNFMASYAFKEMLIRIQTGQIAGRLNTGGAFTGPYTDVIAVYYGGFIGAVGGRYTRMVRPVTTSTYTDAGGERHALDESAYLETIGPVLFSDRMFEAIRDGRLYGPGIYEIGDNTAFGIDVIVQIGLSRLVHSLPYQRNVQETPGSFVTVHGVTELRGLIMYLPIDGSFAGSGGFFVKNTMIGAGSDASENLRPDLIPEFHFGPFVRLGGLF